MATEWIVIAVTDLNDYLVSAQVEALRTAALAVDQADPFTAVMPDIAQRIRLKIQSCARNRISETANALPPELKWMGCYLILEAMQLRLPGLRLTEDQRTQVSEAKRQLDRIADCKDVVSEPLDPEESGAQQPGGIALVNSTTRTATREKMDGL